MTSILWYARPVRRFAIAELIATQPGVLLHALVGDPVPVGGDPWPHVILWRGDAYLEDGHHRAVRALLAGHSEIEARWLRVGS